MSLLQFFENMIGIVYNNLPSDQQSIILAGCVLTLCGSVFLIFWIILKGIKGLVHHD